MIRHYLRPSGNVLFIGDKMKGKFGLKSRNDIGAILEERNLNGIGIEIGVATGNYSQILLDNTKLKKIYFVDTWKYFSDGEYKDPCNVKQKKQNARYHSVVKRLSPYGERAEIIKGDCSELVHDFPDEYFDLVYIDANHEYKYIKRDMADWYPKVKVGGVFAGHDYVTITDENKLCGVEQAVNEFCELHGLEVSVTGGTRRIPPSWILLKEGKKDG